MKITKSWTAGLIALLAIASWFAVVRAQQSPRIDAPWMAPVLVQPVQLEWVARDRVRVSVGGQGSDRMAIEAASVTVTTTAEGITLSAIGQASLTSPLQPILTAESVALTLTRDGSLHGSVTR